MSNILIVYYFRKGENYWNGSLRNLDKGNTERVAEFVQKAVGGAVGRNPISIIVPCHRVIGANGSLTGYAGGIERKAALLRLEGIAL